VLLESILLSLTGGLAGWMLGRALIAALSPAIAARTGVVIGLAPVVAAELALVPALTLLAALAGYLPAMTAYRTDVAKALASAS
jgi:putative ABC transport system permease protein